MADNNNSSFNWNTLAMGFGVIAVIGILIFAFLLEPGIDKYRSMEFQEKVLFLLWTNLIVSLFGIE